jgi:hypothetical protein
MLARPLLLAVLLVGCSALAVAPAAEAGMHVGAQVCFEAIPLSCVGACVDTFLSPPDLCPTVLLPL